MRAKVLSVRQPWAWLIIRPDVTDPAERQRLIDAGIIKDIENRSWRTRHRGETYIHASKAYPKRNYQEDCFFFQRHGITLPPYEQLQLGGIIGKVDVVDCVKESDSPWLIPGCIGWVLKNSEPVPFFECRGQLGLFEVEL